MRTIVAIDPGLRSPGVSVLVDGRIVACARVAVPRGLARLDRGMRAHAVAERVAGVAREALMPHLAAVACVLADAEAEGRAPDVIDGLRQQLAIEVVYEWPQVYGRFSRGDPNDLIPLAAVGAAAAAMLGALVVRAPTPSEWAGQVPKATTGDAWASPRGARVRARLSPTELELVPAQHDAIDGAAIGLWAAGRFERRVVIAR